jgi:hypothetical protein
MTTPNQGMADFTAATAIAASDVVVSQTTAVVIAKASGYTVPEFQVTTPAYAVTWSAFLPSGSTAGLLRVTLNWIDSSTSAMVSQQRWYVPATSTTPAENNILVCGRGPTEADTMSITIENYDPDNQATVYLNVWQSSRFVTRHDWRGTLQSGSLFGYTSPANNMSGLVIAWETDTEIPASSNVAWQCPLYAGQALLTLPEGLAEDVDMSVSAILPDAASGFAVPLYQLTTAASLVQAQLSLPRCPVIVSFGNTAATANAVEWSLIAQEFAS